MSGLCPVCQGFAPNPTKELLAPWNPRQGRSPCTRHKRLEFAPQQPTQFCYYFGLLLNSYKLTHISEGVAHVLPFREQLVKNLAVGL